MDSSQDSDRPERSPLRRVEFGAASGQEFGDDNQVDPHGVDPHGVDPHWVELGALVSAAERNRADMARLQAERAEVCAAALELVAVRVAQRQAARSGGGRAGDVGDSIPLREVMAELAAAMRVGERTISSWLGDGAALVSAYPATLEALREGRIDERHASAIIDAGAALDAGNRGVFEELILPVAEVDTAAAVREHARVIAARLQPEIVEARHREALAARQVKTYPLHEGLARLLLDGPAALIQGVFERVTDMAAALGDDSDGEGDEACGRDGQHGGDSDAAGGPDACTPDARTLDQRRADVALDLLLTGAPAGHSDSDGDRSALGAIRATVRVAVPILTLMGESDEPALLDGYGPIDADTARVLAAGASCWERVMIHPLT